MASPTTAQRVMRSAARREYVEDLRDGRKVGRATTFRAKKGPGSYNRTTKHKENYR